MESRRSARLSSGGSPALQVKTSGEEEQRTPPPGRNLRSRKLATESPPPSPEEEEEGGQSDGEISKEEVPVSRDDVKQDVSGEEHHEEVGEPRDASIEPISDFTREKFESPEEESDEEAAPRRSHRERKPTKRFSLEQENAILRENSSRVARPRTSNGAALSPSSRGRSNIRFAAATPAADQNGAGDEPHPKRQKLYPSGKALLVTLNVPPGSTSKYPGKEDYSQIKLTFSMISPKSWTRSYSHGMSEYASTEVPKFLGMTTAEWNAMSKDFKEFMTANATLTRYNLKSPKQREKFVEELNEKSGGIRRGRWMEKVQAVMEEKGDEIAYILYQAMRHLKQEVSVVKGDREKRVEQENGAVNGDALGAEEMLDAVEDKGLDVGDGNEEEAVMDATAAVDDTQQESEHEEVSKVDESDMEMEMDNPEVYSHESDRLSEGSSADPQQGQISEDMDINSEESVEQNEKRDENKVTQEDLTTNSEDSLPDDLANEQQKVATTIGTDMVEVPREPPERTPPPSPLSHDNEVDTAIHRVHANEPPTFDLSPEILHELAELKKQLNLERKTSKTLKSQFETLQAQQTTLEDQYKQEHQARISLESELKIEAGARIAQKTQFEQDLAAIRRENEKQVNKQMDANQMLADRLSTVHRELVDMMDAEKKQRLRLEDMFKERVANENMAVTLAGNRDGVLKSIGGAVTGLSALGKFLGGGEVGVLSASSAAGPLALPLNARAAITNGEKGKAQERIGWGSSNDAREETGMIAEGDNDNHLDNSLALAALNGTTLVQLPEITITDDRENTLTQESIDKLANMLEHLPRDGNGNIELDPENPEHAAILERLPGVQKRLSLSNDKEHDIVNGGSAVKEVGDADNKGEGDETLQEQMDAVDGIAKNHQSEKQGRDSTPSRTNERRSQSVDISRNKGSHNHGKFDVSDPLAGLDVGKFGAMKPPAGETTTIANGTNDNTALNRADKRKSSSPVVMGGASLRKKAHFNSAARSDVGKANGITNNATFVKFSDGASSMSSLSTTTTGKENGVMTNGKYNEGSASNGGTPDSAISTGVLLKINREQDHEDGSEEDFSDVYRTKSAIPRKRKVHDSFDMGA